MIRTGYDDFSQMKWKQEFSVDSSKIDNQHKKFIAFKSYDLSAKEYFRERYGVQPGRKREAVSA